MKKKLLLLILIAATGLTFAEKNDASNVKHKHIKLNEQNSPTVGSRQQGSSQQYDTHKLKGKKGEVYEYGKQPQNNALVGSIRQGSDQQFGNQPLTGTKGKRPDYSNVPKQVNNPTVGGRQSGSDQLFNN